MMAQRHRQRQRCFDTNCACHQHSIAIQRIAAASERHPSLHLQLVVNASAAEQHHGRDPAQDVRQCTTANRQPGLQCDQMAKNDRQRGTICSGGNICPR
jgi:hypothetical protein